nr:MAG TPA: AAA domain protein [Caudoviricetes sp.]
MIKQANELTFGDKKFSMILYGAPGVGKTTLALSAPNPVLIDFDKGVSRVKAYHRRLTIVCDTYEEVLNDIQDPEIKDCETIIIDTGGSFVSYLQDYVMRENPAVNKQKNGAISLKGFGAVKQEFQRFTNMVRDVMNKNVIYVFHSDEQKDKDGNPQQRLLCEGAARNIVWQPCDFGGYVQMIGNTRVVTFTPTQEFFAKGCYGIEGQFNVPSIGPADKNEFLTNLFEKARANIEADNEAFAPLKEQYDATMIEVRKILDNIKTVDDANAAVASLPSLNHALTSKKEASALLSEKAKELGFTWDKTSKGYVVPAAESVGAN